MSQPERSAAAPAKEEESEEESEILEESPCGRWQKRREQVRQGNIHGVETTYLAMDTEEGVEAVWNEVHFIDRRVFQIHEENIKFVFEHFMQLEHPNIVKFHWYWIDSKETPTSETSVSETPTSETPTSETPARETPTRETSAWETPARETPASETPASETPTRETSAWETPARETPARETPARETPARETPARETTARETPARETTARETSVMETPIRVVFITEYISSGSLKQFLKKTKKIHKTMHEKAWRRWCTQILSALSYLHSWESPLIHGTLTCDAIFIQHNGLIKIGSALPDAPRTPLRSPREEQKNRHFFAPEYDAQGKDSTAMDIFAFGICALEMAVLEVQRNADSSVSPETITNTCRSLQNPLMKDFIQKCLAPDPLQRLSAHDLLFHRVLFEVHPLKLLAAHSFINNQYLMQENCVEETTKRIKPSTVMAEIRHGDRPGVQWTYCHVSTLELDKFLEDVKNGIYPLMTFSSNRPPHLFWAEPQTLQTMESLKSPTSEVHELETRKVIQMQCHLELQEDNIRWHLTLFLKLDDKLHRQLSCDLLPSDGSQELAGELVRYGFISQDDCQKLTNLLEDTFSKHKGKGAALPSRHPGNGD